MVAIIREYVVIIHGILCSYHEGIYVVNIWGRLWLSYKEYCGSRTRNLMSSSCKESYVVTIQGICSVYHTVIRILSLYIIMNCCERLVVCMQCMITTYPRMIAIMYSYVWWPLYSPYNNHQIPRMITHHIFLHINHKHSSHDNNIFLIWSLIYSPNGNHYIHRTVTTNYSLYDDHPFDYHIIPLMWM